MDKSVDELEEEQKNLKMRRAQLKRDMIEETHNAQFNRMKILTHWRKLLRLAKTEQLKKEISIYQQNHDREVDAKDAILQMLDRDLDEAEEQFQMALRNHLIHVDELIDLQNARLQGLHEEFERDVEIVKSEYDTEKMEIERSHNQERQELLDMISTIEEQEEGKLQEMQSNFESEREEIKNHNVELLEGMKHELIRKIEEMDTEFEHTFNAYEAETKSEAASYENLLKRNEKNSLEINQKQRAINRVKEQTLMLNLKMKQNSKECEERNTFLKKERDKIVEHYHQLKRTMATTRAKEEKRLGDLTMNTKRCMDNLKDYQRLGEKILKTSELCRKLETEKEKVLPFYQSDEVTLEEVPDIYIEKIEGIKKNQYNEF